jgi:hypothetical protein
MPLVTTILKANRKQALKNSQMLFYFSILLPWEPKKKSHTNDIGTLFSRNNFGSILTLGTNLLEQDSLSYFLSTPLEILQAIFSYED